MAAQKVMLKNVVMAFPAVAEPQSFGDGDPAYGAKFPITRDGEHQAQIEEAILAVAKEEWKDKAEGVLEMLREDKKLCFVKQVYRSKSSGEPYSGFEDRHYLSARNAKTQPSVYDTHGDELTTKAEIEREAFSGAVVHASLEIWAQDNKWGRRINCSLRGVMTTGEGEHFGGGSPPATPDEFDGLAKAKPEPEDLL